MNIAEDICRCIEEVLEIGQGSVTKQSNSDDTEGWDSLGQLRIIMSVEEKYGVRFKTEEIPKLDSVLKLAERLEQLVAH